uniref:Uncharacterized protein n=1 Tax=Arundo donax TaxID=35708 RepID=A0A0A9HGZ1_ARUDO
MFCEGNLRNLLSYIKLSLNRKLNIPVGNVHYVVQNKDKNTRIWCWGHRKRSFCSSDGTSKFEFSLLFPTNQM